MKIPIRTYLAAWVTAWLSCGLGGLGLGQTVNQSSAQSPFYGSVTAEAVSSTIKQLSIDDAIQMGAENNLGLVEARGHQATVEAQTLKSLQPLLPTITAQAETGVHQLNLAAEGFTASAALKFPMPPGVNLSTFHRIIRVDRTVATLNYSQTLFNLSLFDHYQASKALARAAYFNTQSARGMVVLEVGTAYLEALAARTRVDNAHALLRAGQLVLDQTVAKHKAGTAANLDELRARVELQTQQQNAIGAENDFEKAKITLNREIGLPPEQQIQLADAVPYSDLAEMGIAEAQRIAYRNRQDYQGMQAQIRAAELELKAVKRERLPSLDFQGNYGVTGVTHGLYHGTFLAEGMLNVPIFEEARFRGDHEVASANLSNLTDQFANLKRQIDQQLRDSLLDVRSTSELVRVAQSNVELARQELQQTIEQFEAGVNDNLPVVQAEAVLAGAESNLVDTTVEFNEAKLGLARNLGIIDTQYNTYLRGR